MSPPRSGVWGRGPSGFGRSPNLSNAVEPHGVLPTRDSFKQGMVRGGIPLAFPELHAPGLSEGSNRLPLELR